MKSIVFFALTSLITASSVAQQGAVQGDGGQQTGRIKVNMNAGLWQHAMTFEGDGKAQYLALQQGQSNHIMNEMQANLKNLPPEQRKMVEEGLAQARAQAGKMPNYESERFSMTDSGITTKDCITQAEIDKGWVPDAEEGCTSAITEVGKNKFRMINTCEGENAMSMSAEVAFSSPARFSGKGTYTQTAAGQTYIMPIALEGKWVGKDCGTIE